MKNLLMLSVASVAFCVSVHSAQAQWDPPGAGYANLYTWQLGTSGQPLNKNTYLWDRYYYNNPNVSPYLNLSRIQPYGGNDYFTYVQPMEQQRQRQATMSLGGPTVGGRFDSGPTNATSSMVRPKNPFSRGPGGNGEIMPYNTDSPNRSSSYYSNHYYGGWEGRN